MANITYKPAPGDPATVQWGGQTFEANKSQKVENPALLAKAKNNPFFEVSGASKDEEQQAEVVGNFRDANTGDDVRLVRMPRQPLYQGPVAGPSRPTPPTAATQGSTATIAAAQSGPATRDVFADTYGAPQAEVASGEYEGAPKYEGPQGTKGKPGRPAGSKNK